MNFLQQTLISIIGITALVFFLFEVLRLKKNKSIYGLTNYLFFLGVFVWGDLIILGPFWILTSLISLYFNNWYLFLLIVSVFWSIRSFGEVVYWLNEQFAPKNRNNPDTLRLYKFVKNDSVWFIYQLFWQCIFVVSIIFSIYFSKLWLFS
jgi:hypothetical protein